MEWAAWGRRQAPRPNRLPDHVFDFFLTYRPFRADQPVVRTPCPRGHNLAGAATERSNKTKGHDPRAYWPGARVPRAGLAFFYADRNAYGRSATPGCPGHPRGCHVPSSQRRVDQRFGGMTGRRRDPGVVVVHAGRQPRALIDKMELPAELHRVGRTELLREICEHALGPTSGTGLRLARRAHREAPRWRRR